MPPLGRRSLLLASAGLPLTLAASRTAGLAHAAETVPPPKPAAPAEKGVTRTLARYVVGASYDDLPAKVCKEGVRTLLNRVGVAIGGSPYPTVGRGGWARDPLFRAPP